MKNPLKHNISVPLREVDAFLNAIEDKTCTPVQSAKIAQDLISAMREARAKLQKGFDSPNLTVCVGKVVYVDPKDVQKFITGEIPRLTVYRNNKDTRHMPLYMKHTPKFYIENAPKAKPGARNKTPRILAKKGA